MGHGRWIPRAAFVLLSVLLAGSMWVVPYLPTNDGPEWVFASHVENHYSDPGTVYREIFIPALQFASRGFALVYGWPEAWLGWQRGLQVALTATVLVSAWGFVALVRAIAPERWALGFLGFPLALSWSLYMGLWPFAVSTAIGVVVLAVGVSLRGPTWRGRVALSGLLLVNAAAHVFGAVLTGGAVLALSLGRAERGTRLAEVGKVLATGAPAAGVLVAAVVVLRRVAAAPVLGAFDRFAWRDVLLMLPRTIAPGPLPRALVILVGVAGAAVVAAIRAVRRDTTNDDRALGVAGVALVVAGIVAPFQIPGWQAFSERFIPLGVALTIAVLPLERLPRNARRLAPPALFCGAAVWLLSSYPFHQRLLLLCPDAVEGLAAPVKVGGVTLPVIYRGTELPTYDRITAEVPLMLPLRHMGTLYAVAHGGVAEYSFAGSSAVNAFAPRPGVPRRPLPDFEHYMRVTSSYRFHRDLAFRRQVDDELASFGVFYDAVSVFGALPEDVDVWRERGYVADWARGTVFLGHFEPCTIDFTVRAPPDPAPVFDVHVGAVGLLSNVRVPAVVQSDGLTHYQLYPSPCGKVSLRARWAPSGSALERSCSNRDAEGDITAMITRSAHTIACDGPF